MADKLSPEGLAKLRKDAVAAWHAAGKDSVKLAAAVKAFPILTEIYSLAATIEQQVAAANSAAPASRSEGEQSSSAKAMEDK